jgi:hypothetical protein
MNGYNALTLAEVLNRIEELMPPIVPPDFGESVPVERMDTVLSNAKLLGKCEEMLFEAHFQLTTAYLGLGIYCGYIEELAFLAPHLVVDPMPANLLSAMQKIGKEDQESQKERLAAGRSFDRFQLAIAQFDVGESDADQCRLVISMVSTGCKAIQGAVAALSSLGKVFTLAAACRLYILTLKEMLALANDNDAAEEAAREKLLAVIALHERTASVMKNLSTD